MFDYSGTSSVYALYLTTSFSWFHPSKIAVLLRFDVIFHFSNSHGAIQIIIHNFKINLAIHNLDLDLKT